MTNDERDILEMLLLEIDFFRKGGCVRLLDTPWLLKSLFQDSLVHFDHGYLPQTLPGSIGFERADDGYMPPEFEQVVTNWLRARITKIKNTVH